MRHKTIDFAHKLWYNVVILERGWVNENKVVAQETKSIAKKATRIWDTEVNPRKRILPTIPDDAKGG